jgi:hypothetical protein
MRSKTFVARLISLPAVARMRVSAAASGAFAQEKKSNSSVLHLLCDAQNAGAIYAARKFQCRTAIPDLTIHTN